MSIYSKLHSAKKSIEAVKKNAKNPHFKNSYADLNALIEAVEPMLLEQGLLLLQPIIENRVFSKIIDIETSEFVESYIDLPINLTPQQLGSAVTYYRRYTIQSLLSLQAVDDDGNDANKGKQPTKNYEQLINDCKTQDELKALWLSMPTAEKTRLAQLKENKKNNLK